MYQTLRKMPELAALPLLIVIGLGFFTVTNPAKLPPAVLMVGFAILTGILYCIVRLVARLLNLKERVTKGQYNGILAGATGLPIMMLALQSLGQLTVRDTVTLAVLAAAGYFYMSRLSGTQ
jgi:membrane protein implicated in regulation of membrane protease activity